MINLVLPQNQPDSSVNQAGIAGLPQRITQAIKTAAARTGVDFSYLLNKASQESGFDPNAKASSSSATGLFQFTNQTWLQMVKEHGDQYGLGAYASQIQTDGNGVNHVSNPTVKQAILNLRKDPQISAEMAGELDKDNLSSLKANVGGKIGATDLYLAHFLGAGGASDFLNTMKANPKANAATVLPDAAAANPSVFYNAEGQPRSLQQIYQHFAQKFDGPSSSTMVASAQMPTQSSLPSSSYAVASAAYTSSGNFTPPVMSGGKIDTSSLYANVILAQMNMDNGNMASLGTAALSAHGKRDAMAILGGMA